MKSVLMLAYRYPPNNTSGVFRSLFFANHIVRRGKWVPYVLTVDEKYYSNEDKIDKKLEERINPNVKVIRTKCWHIRESIIGLKNKIVKSNITDNVTQNTAKKSEGSQEKLPIKRLVDIISEDVLAFPDKQNGWLPFAIKSGLKAISDHQIDVIYSSASPWTSHLCGYILKKITKLPLILDYRDPWYGNREKFTQTYQHLSYLLEKKIIDSADKVICNTDRFRKFYIEKFGNADKFITITNGFEPDDQQVRPDSTLRMASRDRLKIIHAGSIYGKRNPDNFIQAVINLHNSGVKLQVILIGSGEDKKIEEKIKLQKSGMDVFTIMPHMAHKECLNYLQDADILLLFQQGTPMQVPRKLYEYIGIGKPILGICDEGETEDIILRNKFGLTVRDNVEDIEKGIKKIIDSPELYFNCNKDAAYQYNNKPLSLKLEELFDSVRKG